jgi:hypothetical protein
MHGYAVARRWCTVGTAPTWTTAPGTLLAVSATAVGQLGAGAGTQAHHCAMCVGVCPSSSSARICVGVFPHTLDAPPAGRFSLPGPGTRHSIGGGAGEDRRGRRPRTPVHPGPSPHFLPAPAHVYAAPPRDAYAQPHPHPHAHPHPHSHAAAAAAGYHGHQLAVPPPPPLPQHLVSRVRARGVHVRTGRGLHPPLPPSLARVCCCNRLLLLLLAAVIAALTLLPLQRRMSRCVVSRMTASACACVLTSVGWTRLYSGATPAVR